MPFLRGGAHLALGPICDITIVPLLITTRVKVINRLFSVELSSFSQLTCTPAFGTLLAAQIMASLARVAGKGLANAARSLLSSGEAAAARTARVQQRGFASGAMIARGAVDCWIA